MKLIALKIDFNDVQIQTTTQSKKAEFMRKTLLFLTAMATLSIGIGCNKVDEEVIKPDRKSKSETLKPGQELPEGAKAPSREEVLEKNKHLRPTGRR